MMEFRLRPARDLGLSQAERLRSHGRESGLGGRLVQAAWRGAVGAWLAVAHRLAVTGAENLPAEPPFVLVANHCSHLDTLVLGSVLRGRPARQAHALAAGDVFFGSTAVALFAAYTVNALPVWRRRTSAGDISALRTRLVEDELVFILFPEGTRSRDGTMAPFQPGIGMIVGGLGVPVVPCRLEGCHAAWPAGRRLPRPGRVRLTIGAPLRFDTVPQGREGWRRIAAECEAAVRGLG
jgi:1-acyl-sn-glycerol-3-phosphate acyltransferase